MGTKREVVLTLEEFAYMSAVYLARMDALKVMERPDEGYMAEVYTKEEIGAWLDEAYRRRLD